MVTRFFSTLLKSRRPTRDFDPTSLMILKILKKYGSLDSTEITYLVNQKLKKAVKSNTIRRKLLELKSLGYVGSHFDLTLKKTVYYLVKE